MLISRLTLLICLLVTLPVSADDHTGKPRIIDGVKYSDLRCADFLQSSANKNEFWLPLLWLDGVRSFEQSRMPVFSEWACTLTSEPWRVIEWCNQNGGRLLSSVYEQLDEVKFAKCKEKNLKDIRIRKSPSKPIDALTCGDIWVMTNEEISRTGLADMAADYFAWELSFWFDGYYAAFRGNHKTIEYEGPNNQSARELIQACKTGKIVKIIDVFAGTN